MTEMKLRVLIAEDEPLSRERLRQLLEAETMTEIVAECATGQEALKAIQQTLPDIVFLDVKMPDLDGFGVIERLSEAHRPVIVFVTAYDRFALRAFEVNAADYLLKPFDRERFRTALLRASERLQRKSDARKTRPLSETLATLETRLNPLDRLMVKSQGRISIVKTVRIDWICAADNYVELHVEDTIHLLRTTITALANQLPENRFARISRSLLVNLDRVMEIHPKSHGDFVVLLHNGTSLTGSRSYRHNLAPLLGNSPSGFTINARVEKPG
jgi:two-component system LytT family response regulator